MPLPYDPIRDDDAGVPLDMSRPAPSLGVYQHAATSTAVAPFRSGRIRPTGIQDHHPDTEVSDDSHTNTTESPQEPSAPTSSTTSRDQDDVLIPQDSLMKEQSKLIKKWATRSSMELAAILENNMKSHFKKEYRLKAKAHREEMTAMLRAELTPVVYSELCKEMRPTVNSDLRVEQLPLVRQELREEALRRFVEPLKQRVMDDVVPYKAQQIAKVDQEVEAYDKQRKLDAENASNTYFNNQCHDMDEELQDIYEEKYREKYRECEAEIADIRTTKFNSMEDEVENSRIRYWESERIRVNEDMDEYETTKAEEVSKKFDDAKEELRKQEELAYSNLRKHLRKEKRGMKIQIDQWKTERMAALDAEIASEKASRLSQIRDSAAIPTPGEERPLGREQGATGSESNAGNGKPSSLDKVNTSEKSPIVDQDENGPEETKGSHEDMQKGRCVAPNKSRAPQTSVIGTKRARENGEETAKSKSDSEIESESVSINQKHDCLDESTRPIKRIRHHSSSPCSFVVDTTPSAVTAPKIAPKYERSTDCVLGAKALVPKAHASIQNWGCSFDAPEQQDPVGTRGTRYFESSPSVTAAVNSTGIPAASSTGATIASPTEIANANSPGIVMSTTKDYQFGQYKTLVDPAIMARAMTDRFQSSKLEPTQEEIPSSPAAAADEDEDDEL